MIRTISATMCAAALLATASPLGAQGTGGSTRMHRMNAMTGAAPLAISMRAQNGSGENGTATLRDSSAGLVVTLHVMTAKGPQPAHIHSGTCANLDPKPEEPLHNVVNGVSVTTIPGLTIARLLSSAHAINVHKSSRAIAVYVSCGNLRR